ncbi:MAG: NAD(P)H-dependent oxidoreductase [Bacteroidota bacterium]
MKRILVFGSSNSKKLINKQLAIYAARKLKNAELVIIDLNDFNLPLYSPDLQEEQGMPTEVVRFNDLLLSAEGIILSMAEYNGCYTTVFKNIFDWLSRIDKNVWKGKPMLLMGTSPDKRGAKSVIQIAKDAFPYYGGNVITDFSLPQFNQNFQAGKLINEVFERELNAKIEVFQEAL